MSIRLATPALITGALFLPPMASGQEATDAAQPAAGGVPQADVQFAQEAAASGKAEVELARIGVEKAESREVKQFAQRLTDDHTKANDQLMQIAQGKGIEIPAEPSAEATAEKERISGLSGGGFDREFVTHFVSSHEKGVEKYAKQAETGQDAELKQLAEQTLPTLCEHLEEAKRLEMSLQQVAGSETPEQVEPAAGTTAGAAAEGTAGPPGGANGNGDHYSRAILAHPRVAAITLRIERLRPGKSIGTERPGGMPMLQRLRVPAACPRTAIH